MAPLIEMKANQVRCLGDGGGSSAIATNISRHVALESTRTTRFACSIMRLVVLATTDPTLLASRFRIKNLGLLSRTL